MTKYTIGDIIEDCLSCPIEFNGNAFKTAKERGWLIEFSEGQFVYTEGITNLFKAFQEMFRREVGEKLDFKEWILPRLLPKEVLEKFGSVEFAPRSIFQATQFYENPKNRRSYFLDTVQSASLYYALAKKKIQCADLPLKVFETIGGYQWRNERKEELHGFDKLFEYLKLEYVYVGLPEQVVNSRRLQAKRYKELFNELGLVYKVVVGAPCHTSPQNTERYEKAGSLDEIPLFDFEFLIPSENRWLEVCGTCVEADENTKSFGIETSGGKELWSGCSGVGLNRMVYAFLSQRGFDAKKYPPLFQKYLGIHS